MFLSPLARIPNLLTSIAASSDPGAASAQLLALFMTFSDVLRSSPNSLSHCLSSFSQWRAFLPELARSIRRNRSS